MSDAENRGDDFTPTGPDAVQTSEKDDLKPEIDQDEADLDDLDTEEEAKAKAEAEPADKKAKGKDSRLPLARHQEILAKERERREVLEREVASLKQGQQVAKTNEDITGAENAVLAMEKTYLELLAKGEVEKAAAKMAEIRRTERSIVQAEGLMQTQAAEARAYERVKYDTTVERLEAAYPGMNPDHEDYDAERTNDVVEMRDAYLSTGKYTRAEALQKASRKEFGASTRKQEVATEVDVRVDKGEVAKQVTADRKKAAVEKNLDTAKRQPASTTGIGQDSDKAGGKLKGADVIKMSQKDFTKLAESDLAVLRGDTL